MLARQQTMTGIQFYLRIENCYPQLGEIFTTHLIYFYTTSSYKDLNEAVCELGSRKKSKMSLNVQSCVFPYQGPI